MPDQVSREPQTDCTFAPAMVVNKIDIGFLIKYELRFDDGVVCRPFPVPMPSTLQCIEFLHGRLWAFSEFCACSSCMHVVKWSVSTFADHRVAPQGRGARAAKVLRPAAASIRAHGSGALRGLHAR